MPARVAAVSILSLIVLLDAVTAEEPLIPFVISYDAPENITNLSGWLDKPAGKQGFVHSSDPWIY